MTGFRRAIASGLFAMAGLAACEAPPETTEFPPADAGFPWADAAPPRLDAGGADGGSPNGSLPSDAGGGDANGASVPFSIVVLPDTQYYSAYYPATFDQQTAWIVAQHTVGNIAFVLHEGDIVDGDTTEQWERAAHSLHMLDNVVPYVLAAGNHDYATGTVTTRGSMIDMFFPVAMFEQHPWFKGTFEPGHIENSYQLFEVPNGGGRWLVIALEFGPRDVTLAWADGIAKQYADTLAIVVTHAYLYDDDTRYDHIARPHQAWNPHGYYEGPPGGVNDGEEMWQKLVLGNSNIRFVLSGHVLNSGVGRLTSERPDGTFVHQILANYQNMGAGGDGFLRVMQFFPAERQLHVRTYSPASDTFRTDSENEFVLGY